MCPKILSFFLLFVEIKAIDIRRVRREDRFPLYGEEERRMESNFAELPKLDQLPAQALGFVGRKFKLNEDLHNARHLFTELNSNCTALETQLRNLQTKLSSSLFSWSSLSIRAKSSLQDVIATVENLTLITSQHGSTTYGARESEKILTEELPDIAREMRRIADVRGYAEIALKLEALVGDLEDSVISVLKHRTGDSCSRAPLNLRDFDTKQENILHAVKAIKDIEDMLHDIVKLPTRWPRLVKTVDSRVDKIFSALRPQVLVDHRSLLSTLGWPPNLLTFRIEDGEASGIPNPLVLMQGHQRESYSKSFLALSALQQVQMQRDERRLNILARNKEENHGLWAIDELVSPIVSRMEYHLLKWVAQPELMFALVYKTTRDLIGVDDILQPLIDQAKLVGYSAKESWISAMAQMFASFLEKTVFVVLAGKYEDKHTKADSISSWLHLVDLIIAFDARMLSLSSSDAHLLSGESEMFIGPGRIIPVLSLFCGRSDWLQIWAKMELKDAWKKLKAELEVESSWVTNENHEDGEYANISKTEQFLLTAREDHKAPVIAEFALKIAWEMMQRCKTLPSTSARIEFIRSTSSKFLRKFVNGLLLWHEGIGFSTNDSDEALTKVCTLVNAARFCEFKLQEWSEDISLLELKIAEIGKNTGINADTLENTCFFSEEIKSLTELQTNWLTEVVAHILRQFETLSYQYFLHVAHLELVAKDFDRAPALDLTISTGLVEALDYLRSQLLLVKQHLNSKDFLNLWRSVADGLDHFIFYSILTSNICFSCDGVKQFVADMEGLFFVYRVFCARSEAFFPRISDLLKLLKLDRERVTVLISLLSDNDKGVKCLVSYGVSHISVDQAEVVLSNRTF
ncbi:hypothetical protein Dimus_021499 [Dionaea muscipula]